MAKAQFGSFCSVAYAAPFLLGFSIGAATFAAAVPIVPAPTSPWPQFGIDAAGTRRSEFIGPVTQPELKWFYPTGPVLPGLTRELLYATPTLSNEQTILAPSYDGYLHAVGRDGVGLWSYPIGSQLRASATVGSDGSIYNLSPKGFLKLNSDGVVQFQNASLVNDDPSVTISDDRRLYVASVDELFALDKNGSVIWSLEVGSQIEGTPVIGNGGTVYFGSQNEVLNAVSDQGSLLWTFPIPGRNVKSATIGEDGTIYAGGQSGDFFAISPTGALKWQFSDANQIFTAAAIRNDNSIVFAATDAIYALDSNGTQLWRYVDQSFVHGSVFVDPKGSVFATRNNRVLGLDASGNLMWEFATDPASTVYSSIAIDRSGILYFGAGDGLYAIGAATIPEPSSFVLATVATLLFASSPLKQSRCLGNAV